MGVFLKSFLLLFVACFSKVLIAQVNPRRELKDSIHVRDSVRRVLESQEADVLNGLKPKPQVVFKSIPYPVLKASDVGALQNIRRRIDLRDPANRHLVSSGGQSLVAIVLEAVRKKELQVYADADCNIPLTMQQTDRLLQYGDTLIHTANVASAFSPQSIKELQIDEMCFLNKRLGKHECRVLNISLMREYTDSLGETKGMQAFGFLYFPDARYFLRDKMVNYFSTNKNDTMTYEHIFLEHKYSSSIIKMNHVSERSIRDYKIGPDARRESELFQDKWLEQSQGIGED